MIKIAVILFALAAVAGLTMAIGHFRGRTPPPTPLAALHGALAASGLLALLTAVVQGARGASAIALCLFLVAALGGFTLLLGFHLRGRKLPNVMVAGHGLLAVSAFVVLLVAVLAGSA